MKKGILILGLGITLLTSCDTNPSNLIVTDEKIAAKAESSRVENTEEVKVQSEDISNSLGFVYDAEATTIGFGAFKTTEKKEVKGLFTEFELINLGEGSSVQSLFTGADVVITVGSLSTNNEGRDKTLLEEFFTKTTSGTSITGKVLSFDEVNSVASLELLFNDVTIELAFTYQLNNDTLNMKSVLNLEDVNGLEALASINTACLNLHKGSDGVSKTWSDVNIYISTILKH